MKHTIQRDYCLLRQRPFKAFWFALCLMTGVLLCWGVLPSAAGELPVSIGVEQLAKHEASGSSPVVTLWVDVEEGYHVYAHDETAGRPLHVVAHTVPPTEPQPVILYPKGSLEPDPLNPGQVVRVLNGKFPLFVCPKPLADGHWPAQLDVRVSMLLCSTNRCVPCDVSLNIVLDSPETMSDIALFPDTDEAFVQSVPVVQTSVKHNKMETASVEKPNGTAGLASLGLSKQDSIRNSRVDSKQMQHASSFIFSPRSFQEGVEPRALGSALLFGLLAGLVLNVMPCVLPVLTIKITGLLALGGSDNPESRKRRFRRYTFGFAAGIMVWFACLAVLMRVTGLAWGGLFQIDRLVFGMMVLVFLLALSLFDVFVLPVPGVRLGQKRDNASGIEAFLFGMTVTLLATPCSGPLLGGVLAWSVLQTPLVQGAVIMAAGIGMAMPYLLMCLWPAMADRLPRPGAWMRDMERLAGFFLMGTVIYLLSILPDWQWLAALVTLLVVAVCAWGWGRWAGLNASRIRRVVVTLGCTACIASVSWWACTPPGIPNVVWTPFVKEDFFRQLGKEAMLVEFTADWCPTCKVLEKTVLGSDTLQELVERHKLRLIRVDLTYDNPDSMAFLRSLGSVSIPLVALFPIGEKACEPLLLRDLFTAGQLESLVKLAGNSK